MGKVSITKLEEFAADINTRKSLDETVCAELTRETALWILQDLQKRELGLLQSINNPATAEKKRAKRQATYHRLSAAIASIKKALTK